MSVRHELHLGIAEQGKLFALANDHHEALRHYREAIRLAVAGKAPEVFFRHYTQCVLESLEMLGSYDEVVQFCHDADRHYRALEAQLAVQQRDHGAILERLGMVRLKQGQRDEALQALTRAREIAGKGTLPLTEEVLNWLHRGLHVDARRLLQSQHRHCYFVVRADQVDRRRACRLPPADRRTTGTDPRTTIFMETNHGRV